MEDEQPKVLCVDDEASVLRGLELTLFEHFDVTTATSGKEGLATLADEGPFAVVVSDMRMPEMDGAAFLAEARRQWPDTVRILLTGHSDIESAIRAVNEGNIFRFLSKPCDGDNLIGALTGAVAHHRLLTLERDLLANTLGGAVKAMSKLLEILAPTAFRKASAMSAYVRHACSELKLEDAWIFETAALLSQAGHVVIPGETLDKADAGQELSADEQSMLTRAFETGALLIDEIPRMRKVAAIVRALGQPPKERVLEDATVAYGVRLLVAVDQLDNLCRKGIPLETAIPKVQGLAPNVRRALTTFQPPRREGATQLCDIRGLRSGMILDQDVSTLAGVAVARRGSELNSPMIERLKNFHQSMGIEQPLRVILQGKVDAPARK